MLPSKLGAAFAACLGLALSVEAMPFYQINYDCYVIFGAIQRCYDGRSFGLVNCVIPSTSELGDQTYYEPRSLAKFKYPFGTSSAKLTLISGGYETAWVATFKGHCNDNPDWEYSPAP
ncbi:hypothetical protein BGZ52_003073 [Haplosporangium bisporale]|nr:hypothetical protein BGZ52_003073 [Haplosporangium bisporale]KAI9231021.1 MAG: hypothetical protein BYD32DRAFT_467560 [Podila humilis]